MFKNYYFTPSTNQIFSEALIVELPNVGVSKNAKNQQL